ncbi:MAG: ABC transporter permease [Treponema sp.]|nr:ABC transporter permease [Treponema sp.]
MPLTEQQQNLNEEETRFYTDLEIEILIDEISEAALEAIEQAAGEAARAAVLSMLEREAITLRENQRLRTEAEALRRNRLLIGVLSFIGGLITGVVIKNHLP